MWRRNGSECGVRNAWECLLTTYRHLSTGRIPRFVVIFDQCRSHCGTHSLGRVLEYRFALVVSCFGTCRLTLGVLSCPACTPHYSIVDRLMRPPSAIKLKTCRTSALRIRGCLHQMHTAASCEAGPVPIPPMLSRSESERHSNSTLRVLHGLKACVRLD